MRMVGRRFLPRSSSARRQANAQKNLESHRLPIDLRGLERPVSQRIGQRSDDLIVRGMLHRYLLELPGVRHDRRSNNQLIGALRSKFGGQFRYLLEQNV